MISIVIPAYNEAAAVGVTVTELHRVLSARAMPFEIIVVDDGSTDATGTEAAKAGARVLEHPQNMGYGNALKTGIRAARFEWIATSDADGTYAAEDLVRLIEYIPRFDLVVGARSGPNFWGSTVKQPARRVFLWLSEFVTGSRIPDVNSGLRVFRKSVILEHFPRISGGFSFTTTMTLAMLLEGYFVKYVPIGYAPRVGRSHVRMVRDTLRASQVIVQAILFYNPIKLFLLVALGCLGFSFVVTVGFALTRSWALATLVLWGGAVAAMLILAMGFVADSLRWQRRG